MAGNLAIDSDGDGSYDSLELIEMLHEKVLNKCDALDGISDGVVDNPLVCDFDPVIELDDLNANLEETQAVVSMNIK